MTTQQTITGAEIGLLSYLFEAVGDLLTPAQRQELTDQLTSLRPAGVAPGDLITAELFNAMLNNINDLLARVAVLEGSEGGPVIERIEPQGVDLEVGSQISIVGRNFKPDELATSVKMGDVTVTAFDLRSDENRLIFVIPNSFTGLPKRVDVQVNYAAEKSNVVSVRILPLVIRQAGEVVIVEATQALGEIVAGDPYELEWFVDSQTLLPATYRFSVLFSALSGATEAEWRTGLIINPSAPREVSRGSPQRVRVNVTVPAGAADARIALHAETVDGRFQSTSPPIRFEVGEVAVVTDTRTTIAFGPIGSFDLNGNPSNARIASLATPNGNQNGLQVKFGQSADIPLTIFATSRNAGPSDYVYSAEIEGQTAKWDEGPFDPVNGQNVLPGQSRDVTVRLENSLVASEQLISFLIIKVERRVAGASGPADYTSFIRIPIQGAAF